MKKLLVLLLSQLFVLSVFAQVNSDKYEEKGKRKVEQRVDKKVDKAMDDALNKIEGLFKNKNKNKGQEPEEQEEEEVEVTEDSPPTAEELEEAQEMYNKIYGEESEEDYVPQQNAFIGSFDLVFESFKNGKPDKHNPMLIKMLFDKDETAMLMSQKEGISSRVIMHLDDNTMTMISTDKGGETTGFKMRRPNVRKIVKESMEEMKIVRTGEFRTIDGYKCEKIISTNEKDDMVTTAWVTKDVKIDWKKVTESMTMGKMPVNAGSQDWPEGFAIESETVEKGGKAVHKMKTKNINIGSVDKSAFDTSGVKIMSLPGLN